MMVTAKEVLAVAADVLDGMGKDAWQAGDGVSARRFGVTASLVDGCVNAAGGGEVRASSVSLRFAARQLVEFVPQVAAVGTANAKSAAELLSLVGDVLVMVAEDLEEKE